MPDTPNLRTVNFRVQRANPGERALECASGVDHARAIQLFRLDLLLDILRLMGKRESTVLSIINIRS